MNNWTTKITAFHALLIAIGLVVTAILAGGRWAVNEFRGIVADVTANSMEIKAKEIGLLTNEDLDAAFQDRDTQLDEHWEEILEIASENLEKQDGLLIELTAIDAELESVKTLFTTYSERIMELERKNGLAIKQSTEEIKANQYTDSLQMQLNRALMQAKFRELQERLTADRQEVINRIRDFRHADDRVVDKGRKKTTRTGRPTKSNGPH